MDKVKPMRNPKVLPIGSVPLYPVSQLNDIDSVLNTVTLSGRENGSLVQGLEVDNTVNLYSYQEGTGWVKVGGDSGSVLPEHAEFKSVKTEILQSDTYNTFQSKDGLVLQDDSGDYAYWNRNQGLMLEGQGDVTPLISSSKKVQVKATGFEVIDEHSNVLFSNTEFKALEEQQAYRTIDSIQAGLTESIKNQDTQVRAIHELTNTLASLGKPSTGKVSISALGDNLGLLPPIGSDGYGVLYFDYVKGNVNMTLLKWEDEDGKIYEGVNSASKWNGWNESVSYTALEQHVLTQSLATGTLVVGELKLG